MRLDQHSATHFAGSAFLVCLLAIWIHPVSAAALVVLSGVLWEILDELRALGKLKSRLLDPAGFDILDVLFDFAGVIAGLIIAVTLKG